MNILVLSLVLAAFQTPPAESTEVDSQVPERVVTKDCWASVTKRVSKTYTFEVCERDIAEEEPWLGFEDSGPPLGMWDAVGFASAELLKYSTQPRKWKVSSVQLQEIADNRWVYIVNFKTSHWGAEEFFSIPVLMSGRPIEARVEWRASPSD